VHGTEVKVQFVDYGNTELVDRGNVKPMSSSFLLSPLLAMEVCLDGFQCSSPNDALVQAFETLVLEQELSVTFKDAKTVVMMVGDKDVAKTLQAQGLGSTPQKTPPSPAGNSFGGPSPTKPGFGATSPRSTGSAGGFGATSPKAGGVSSAPATFKEPTPPSGSATAIITHLETDNGNFYVQLLSAEAQLEQLANRLQAVYQAGGPDLKGAVSKDTVCVAKFYSDGCWYR
jgi:hypothetical protein